MISRKSNEFDRGFLKITQRRREVEILQHMARIDAPDNHTIAGVQVWTRNSGGFVVYMSSGGGHLTALWQPDEHVWSAATQLIEGVAFMHQHDVAHRDIKPANVLIPPGGGRLSIIDFSIAVFVSGAGGKIRDVVGTEEYMAPEVFAGDEYDVIPADLWSCGKTLQELCCLCGPSMQTAFLLGISKELMRSDPLQRPMMREVLNRMVAFKSPLSEPRPQMR
jgi:serine/threonine protein kinase